MQEKKRRTRKPKRQGYDVYMSVRRQSDGTEVGCAKLFEHEAGMMMATNWDHIVKCAQALMTIGLDLMQFSRAIVLDDVMKKYKGTEPETDE
jgi:hypothetical protein